MTGDLVGGRYRLGELLGSGGTAAVFRATDERLDREVAVKIVHPHLSAQAGILATVLTEARTSARLDHPHIVRVLDAGADAGAGAAPPVVWMALDLVDGVTLAALVTDAGPLRCADALDVAAGVLAGLTHAHAHGVVHRDLSPSNVMVPRGPEALDLGATVVLDLGASSPPGATTLIDGAVMPLVRVSPHYASPEAAQGLATDERADLYAVGALLHLMLTGSPPFDDADPRAVLEAHVHTRPAAPSSRRRGVPRDLDALVLRALAKAPEDRFATAAEMRIAVVRCRAALASDRPAGTTREFPPAVGRGPGRAPIRVRAPTPVPAAPGRARGAGEGRREVVGPSVRPDDARAGDGTRTGGGVGGLLVGLALALAVSAVLVWQPIGGGDVSALTGPVLVTSAPVPTSTASIPTPLASSAPTPEPTPAPTVELVDVPLLVGLSYEAASLELEAAGLAVGALGRADASAPFETVLTANPATGDRAVVGSAVDLVLASGDVVVPDVLGLGPAVARTRLEAAGLVVAEHATARIAGALRDAPVLTVTGTMPAAGERVVFGGSVVVLVDGVALLAPGPTPTVTTPGPAPDEDPTVAAAPAPN